MTSEPITCSGNDLAAVCADIRLRGGCIEAMDVVGRAMYRVSYFERGDRTIESNDSTKDKQQASENHFGKVATVRGLLLSNAGSARNATTRKPSSVCAEPAALITLRVAENFERADGLVPSRSNPPFKAIQRRTGVIDEPDMRPVTNVSEQPTDAGENPAALNPVLGIRRNRSNATQTSTRPVSEEACKQRDPAMGTEMRADGLTRVSTEGDIAEPSGSGWAHPTNASISSEWRKHQDAPGGLVGEQVHEATPVEVVSASVETNPPSLLTSIESRLAALQSKLLASGKIKRIKPKTRPEHARQPYKDE